MIQQQDFSITQDVCTLYDLNELELLNQVDKYNYCPVCMKKKPERSWHSFRCNRCVEDYYVNSLFFNRDVTKGNYLGYLKLIALQTLFLFFYFFIQIHVLENVKETYMIGYFFEAIYYPPNVSVIVGIGLFSIHVCCFVSKYFPHRFQVHLVQSL